MVGLLLLCLLLEVAVEVLCGPAKQSSLFNRKRLMIRGRPYHGLVPKPDADPKATEKRSVQGYFTQKVDHFNDNGETYNQQFWYNEQWYKPGGPAFLMIGGESAENSVWVERDDFEWTSLAKQHGAMVFLLEHRYYGNSRPVKDMSTANMRYLSSEQAIEDVATFIQGMNQKFSFNTSWITFGGSYSGALSAWVRQKHPELVAGAVGSSGPVQAEVDFTEYLEVVQASLTSYSQQCAGSVKAGFKQMQSLMGTASGRRTLKDNFMLCDDLDYSNKNDVKFFWESMIGIFMGVVQYNQDNVGMYRKQMTIPAICTILTDPKLNALQRMAKVNSYVMNLYGEQCVYISYQGFIDFMKDTNFNGEAADDRSWVYQTCTEFGYYQSTDSPTAGPFFGQTLPSSYYVDWCAAIYGQQFSNSSVYAAIAKTNGYYGGRSGYNATKVVLPNGSVDPWHALGILSNPNPSATAVFIKGTAHCADMYPSSSEDLPSLTLARETVAFRVATWLSN